MWPSLVKFQYTELKYTAIKKNKNKMDLKKFDGNKIFKSHFIFCDIVSYIKQEETSVLIILHVKGIKQLEAIFFLQTNWFERTYS
jgi:hypothetical protein